jgi:hypothetical protein
VAARLAHLGTRARWLTQLAGRRTSGSACRRLAAREAAACAPIRADLAPYLGPPATIRDVSRDRHAPTGATTASIPTPAGAQRRRPTDGHASYARSPRVSSGADGGRRRNTPIANCRAPGICGVLLWSGDRSPIRGCTTSVGVQVPPGHMGVEVPRDTNPGIRWVPASKATPPRARAPLDPRAANAGHIDVARMSSRSPR